MRARLVMNNPLAVLFVLAVSWWELLLVRCFYRCQRFVRIGPVMRFVWSKVCFPFSRPWTASSLWWTWRATSCLCLRMWPSTCATTRRSWWTRASTACYMSEIMLSSSRTCCLNPSVSSELISPASTVLCAFSYLSLSVPLCHLSSMSPFSFFFFFFLLTPYVHPLYVTFM